MEGDNVIHVVFNSHETQILDIMKQYCQKNGISVSDYVKDIIKKDLAWGHFARRKKKQ